MTTGCKPIRTEIINMNSEATALDQSQESFTEVTASNLPDEPEVKAKSFNFAPIGNMGSSLERAANFLQFYLCAAIIANLGLLFWEGNGGDIGFWEDWARQLSNNGYKEFNGNYPPIYIHWLYVVGQIYNYLQLPIENNLFVKFLSQIPIMLSHLILIGIVYQLLKRYCTSSLHFHICMLLTAFNPALYLNGPIWGQVDVMPLIPLLLAILSSTSERFRVLTFPFYTAALLTKFQMIAFLPVMGIIFFRHYRMHLIGCALSIGVIAVGFLPSIMAGSFTQAFKLAYVDVLHQYSSTTMGASNIWVLLTGNAVPDHVVLFGINPESSLAILFKAKNFGMISFFIICLIIFLQGMGKLVEQKLPTQNPDNASQLFFYAMICTMAFFTLLPAMHERYLLPAVIVSLVYYTLTPGKIIYPLAITFVSAYNITMCLGIKTSNIWPSISWIMFAAFCYATLELILGRRWTLIAKNFFFWITGFRFCAAVVLIVGVACVGSRLYHETLIHRPTLAANQRFLTDIPIAYSKQDYGQISINKSVHGNPLLADRQRYAVGLGTHANSIVEYQLPTNSQTLNLLVALDDEQEAASVTFSVWGDDKLLWESSPHYGSEKPEAAEINIEGVIRLRLQVDGMKDIHGDHADWLNPVLTLKDNSNTIEANAQ